MSTSAGDRHPLESMGGMPRRRFLGMAAFASATVVGVGTGVMNPTVAHAAPDCVDSVKRPYPGGRGRWSDVNRKKYIALHHTGGRNQNEDPCLYAAPVPGVNGGCATTGKDKYDFAVNGDGKIAVGNRYTYREGCHAKTCNCEATGVVMLGCFGCGDTPTTAQKCGVGYIWNQTGIERRAEKLKPHRWCDLENPCNGESLGGTSCPGSTYTNLDPNTGYWNSAGIALRNEILNYANRGGC